MSTMLGEALGRPARAPGTPATHAASAPRRRHSWRLATAVVLAVLALGLLLVRADATPRTQLPPAPAGQDPLAAVPDDFAATMGYTPVAVPVADGTVRAVKPNGACSAPGGGTPFGFDRACKAHDYGYDLLRYAHATGQPLSGQARRRLDAMFARDLHARCAETRQGLAAVGCHLVAEVFASGAAVNSWRQGYGNPGRESVPAWAPGLVLPAFAAWLGPRLRRRRPIGTPAARRVGHSDGIRIHRIG
jgi:Prokaryotic phospholipase A2